MCVLPVMQTYHIYTVQYLVYYVNHDAYFYISHKLLYKLIYFPNILRGESHPARLSICILPSTCVWDIIVLQLYPVGKANNSYKIIK